MRSESTRLNIDAIWWLHPGKLILFFVFPIYSFVTIAVPLIWPGLVVLRTRVYMDAEYVAIGAITLLAMGLSALLGSQLSRGPLREPVIYHVNERFLITIGVMTIAAYLIWFWPVIAAGQVLDREELNQTPGVTSFTQFGVTYVIVYMYVTLRAGQRLSAASHWIFRAIIAMTLGRAFVQAERLAMIEIAVPAVAMMLLYYKPRRPGVVVLFRLLSRYGPVLGIPLLFVFFGITEYFRSWTTYQHTLGVSLTDFVIARVATYYYTALNNGAGMLATSSWPDFQFIYILEWVYRLPFGIGDYLWQALGRAEAPTAVFLNRFGDPEFNNMSGIYPAYYDVGLFGGVAYFSLLGLLVGVTHRKADREQRLATLMFPSMIVACIEVMRIMYLNNQRCFLVFAGALLASTQLVPVRRRSVVRLVVDEPLSRDTLV